MKNGLPMSEQPMLIIQIVGLSFWRIAQESVFEVGALG
jgi:hypothetical protein